MANELALIGEGVARDLVAIGRNPETLWQIALPSAEDCRAMEAALMAHDCPCSQADAAKCVAAMIASYPKQPDEPEIYARVMVKLCQDYPASVVVAAVDKITKARRWHPSRADLYEELEAQSVPLRQARAALLLIEREREKRAKQDEENKRIAADRAAMREQFGDKTAAELIADAAKARSVSTEGK